MDIHRIKVACSSCNLRELCLPMGLNDEEMDKLDHLISTRKRVKRGDALFSAGDRFTSLYAVRSGFFKTCVTTADGRDQVTGFQMAGEIIGLDGIVNDRHSCDAIALEDAEVCVMPFDEVEALSREFTTLQHHVHRIMSREIVRDHSVMLLPAGAWLLTVRVQPAHDTRGNRQLPGHEARDGEPHLLQVRRRRHHRRQAALCAHQGHRGLEAHRQPSGLLLIAGL
jgi:CRP-like cAMP-binding protein